MRAAFLCGATLVPLATCFDIPTNMRYHSQPRARVITALTRREVVPPLGFGLLAARLGYLASTKEELMLPSEKVFDPATAIAKADAAAGCAVQSCVDVKLTELSFYLDTASTSMNAKGAASDHTPVVYIAPDFGLSSASVARYNLIIALPTSSASDPVEIIWLKNAESGAIVATKVFNNANRDSSGPPTLLATLKEPFAGVRRGATLIPYSYSKRDGVWEGARFTLPAEGASSATALGPREIGKIDARGKRPAADIGKELLTRAGIAYRGV
jgi:hypothetical protein